MRIRSFPTDCSIGETFVFPTDRLSLYKFFPNQLSLRSSINYLSVGENDFCQHTSVGNKVSWCSARSNLRINGCKKPSPLAACGVQCEATNAKLQTEGDGDIKRKKCARHDSMHDTNRLKETRTQKIHKTAAMDH